MAKKHVCRWNVWVGPNRVEPQAICHVEGCLRKLSALQVERILNAWERRPKYRKVGALGTQTIDCAYGDTLYVKVSR